MLGNRQERLVPGDNEFGLGCKRSADDHIVIRIGRDPWRGHRPNKCRELRMAIDELIDCELRRSDLPDELAPAEDVGQLSQRRRAGEQLAYLALKTTLTNDQAQTRIEEKNAIGELVRATDASGAQLVHQRDAFGNLVATKDALQNAITLSYDVRGRKTRMVDPDAGTWNYDYDALGQLVWQQSPVQLAGATQTTIAYDKLGRLIQRVEPEYTSTWSYDAYADASACNKGVGKLCESSTSAGVSRKFVYDNVGRPINVRTNFPGGPSMASVTAYDSASGRVASQTYPTGLQVGYTYTTRGQLDKLTLKTAATVSPLPDSQGQTAAGASLTAGSTLWQARVVNAWGRTEQQGFGNGVIGRATYEAATGRTTDLSAGLGSATTVLDQHYAWDSLDNLTTRIDDNGDGTSGPVTENFTYADGLNRLTGYTVATPGVPGLMRSVTLQYNALGLLLYKSDVGNYSYPTQGATSVRPHALQSVSAPATTSYTYDANGNLLTASGGKYRTIAYTSFNLPDSQTGAQGPSGTPKYTWLYDESHARIREVHVDATGTRTTWTQHLDNQGGLAFESETAANGALSQRHYLNAAGQTIGVLVSTNPLPTLAAGQTAPPAPALPIPLVKVEYWHKDPLGSLISTTDHTGAVTARYAYDPFGKRRLSNGTWDAAGALVIDWKPTLNWGTDRGFTGHEQLDDIGLVHMNGRIYDAALGRFLQADPTLQDPANLQNFNRYAYCFSNPLNCTDPSGYSSWTEFRDKVLKPGIAIAVSIYLPGAIQGWMISMAGGGTTLFATMSGGTIFSNAAMVTSLGSFSASAVSGFASGAILTGTAKGGIQGAFTASLFNVAGDMLNAQGIFRGGQYYGDSPAMGVTVHAVVGCVTSAAGGGKCGPGALSAAFSHMALPITKGLDPFSGTVVSAVIGGTASELGGGKFANGARTAAMGYLFNYCAHGGKCDTAFEQALYDWWPGYKFGTGLYNAWRSGQLDFSPSEALDGGLAVFGGAIGKGAGLVGQAFGKLGTVVEGSGLTITDFSGHAIDQAISRSVTPAAMLDAVRNPIAVLQQNSGNFLQIGEQAAVVLNTAGRVVTTYPARMYDSTVQSIVNAAKAARGGQ